MYIHLPCSAISTKMQPYHQMTQSLQNTNLTFHQSIQRLNPHPHCRHFHHQDHPSLPLRPCCGRASHPLRRRRAHLRGRLRLQRHQAHHHDHARLRHEAQRQRDCQRTASAVHWCRRGIEDRWCRGCSWWTRCVGIVDCFE